MTAGVPGEPGSCETGSAGIAMQAAIALCAFAGSEMASAIARMVDLGLRERPEVLCMETRLSILSLSWYDCR